MSNLDPVVQIGDWYYQVIYGQLWPCSASDRDKQLIRLEPRLHSLLNFFLLHPNTLLAKDTLIEKVWPADEGTDAAVMRAVGALRKVLGDDVRSPIYIATISKKGYCWLAGIQSSSTLNEQFEADDHAATDNISAFRSAPKQTRRPWRFIVATAASVLLVCAGLAFVLATITETPLLRLPDTISPISALSGQEYWPVLNADQSEVVYQHMAPDSKTLNWSRQNLTDLKVEHLAEQYQQLSQATWFDQQQIVFRGTTTESHCSFYRQQLQPVIAEPVKLWPCQQVLPQALARWRDQWIWLDTDVNYNAQIWSGLAEPDVKLLRTISHNWRKLEYMLLQGDHLYLLAEETQHSSVLLSLELPDGELKLLKQFEQPVNQMSWWAESQLLLASPDQELQIVDVNKLSSQGLGALTRDLTQALRYPGQVLATQYLDYTTDIFRVQTTDAIAGVLSLTPWHVSNRSERLLALAENQAAFVSERAGYSQIWLDQGKDSTQLSRLNEQQQVQQLLWHQRQLLAMIDSQLYQVDLKTGALTPHAMAVDRVGRYTSCDDSLYWTELSGSGWQLYTALNNSKTLLHNDVVDVRCGPEQTLVLQQATNSTILLRTPDGNVTTLTVQIDWHMLSAEQWFTDVSGIYWLQNDGVAVNRYLWTDSSADSVVLPMAEPAVAIYSNGSGLGYVVRPRPHDTDIVWLQNRR